MSKKTLLVGIGIFVVMIGFFAISKSHNKSITTENNEVVKTEKKSYWTCPMHPQIHMDHPGECPICHMTLVKVEEQVSEKADDKNQSEDSQMKNMAMDNMPMMSNQAGGENRAKNIQTKSSQIELAGIQKYTVEKMDLVVRIPISGRMLSNSSVAFQVYEKDLKYIRSGLNFKGESDIYAGEEISGIITSVDSIIDPTSRTVRAVGSIRKGPRGLISEASFRGEIQVALKDRIAIPESSVLQTGKGTLVYLFAGEDKLAPKKIELGLKTEGFYEVISGLEVGDVINSGPNFLIDSEAKIRGGAND